jgi:hypothetical protein
MSPFVNGKLQPGFKKMQRFSEKQHLNLTVIITKKRKECFSPVSLITKHFLDIDGRVF